RPALDAEDRRRRPEAADALLHDGAVGHRDEDRGIAAGTADGRDVDAPGIVVCAAEARDVDALVVGRGTRWPGDCGVLERKPDRGADLRRHFTDAIVRWSSVVWSRVVRATTGNDETDDGLADTASRSLPMHTFSS